MSRQGVQRNLLPLVEGTVVNTNIGPIKTDRILFIAAGAFHQSKPSDLIPELQGRFPARVELEPLTEEDYQRILQEPANAITKQQAALLKAEGVRLEFLEDGIHAMAKAAFKLNMDRENIGAWRLRTIMKQVLDDTFFDVPEKIKPGSVITVDKVFVDSHLAKALQEPGARDYVI